MSNMGLATKKNKSYSKKKRLSKKREIVYVLNKGKKSETIWLAIYVCIKRCPANKTDAECKPICVNRLCVIAKKRFIKKAVDRNSFKRITKEVFRAHAVQPNSTERDCVIVVNKQPDKINKKYFRQEIIALLKKAKLMK